MTSTALPVDGYFQSGNLRIHYLDWGNESATPFVLIHHNQSNAHTWDFFAQRIRDRYRVLAMDMRGHGDSDWAGEGNYTTEHHASDVIALIRHLGLSKVILLGGSTGGRVALVTASTIGDQAAALIMEDVGAVRPPSIAQGFADRVVGGDPEFDTVNDCARVYQAQHRRTPFPVFQHLARYGTKPLPNGKFGLKRDIRIQKDFIALELWRYVEALKAPLLLMSGSLSEVVGEDQKMRFREIRPDTEIVVVEDAGHLIVHDQPEAFDANVLGFLSRHGL